MIDTNELRRLAQAATPGPWISCGPSFGESLPKYLNEVVVDREGDEDDGYSVCTTPIGLEDQCSDDMAFIAATNPAAISELLDRLEAAEKERDAAELMSLALRAKIAEMERQEPSVPEFCPCCGNIMRACMICPNEDCNAVTATAEQAKYNKQHAVARKASGAAAPEAKP